MSNESKISIALIGLGGIAQKAYLPIVANHPKINPILCTRNKEILKQLKNQFRVPAAYSNLEDLIHAKPDAAMVHSSTESHPFIVSELLKNGIPVFVDKPLSYALADTEKLIELASKNKLPLYVGFNRRFAPLIKLLRQEANPIQIHWQKNRVHLPGDPRVFIFDDFIHVIDSLRFLADGEVQDLNVVARVNETQLEQIQVHWKSGATHLLGGMNRVSGITEEKIEYYTPGNKWVINELNTGSHFCQEAEKKLQFSNWDATLYKRGFVDMIEDWISVLEDRKFDAEAVEDIWKTHHLCELILRRVLNKS